jgi:hypothetical protein
MEIWRMIRVHKKIFRIGCILLLMLTLSACQLAREDGLTGQGDRLVGVYVTDEYLDLLDFESYLQDNAPKLMHGGEISADDQDKYNGRVYADLMPQTLTRETGEPTEIWEYVFEGIDGIPFFLAKITQPDGEVYTGSSSDNVINDAHITVGNESSLEGTIYMTPMPEKPEILYVNPVYQSSDGEVYLTTGNGISADMDMKGATFSTTLNEKHTVTKNGKKTEETFTVTVHVAVKHPTKSVGVIQMSAENTPVSREDYAPDALPEEVTVGPDTAYVIVESKILSPSDETIVREIFSPGDDYFTSYAAREDGFFESKSIALLWEESPDRDI